ncbi:hypothetical protein V8E52_004349 [Russula decolorans]
MVCVLGDVGVLVLSLVVILVFLAGFGDGLFDIGSPDMSIIAPVHVFSLSSMRGVGCDHNLSGAWEVLCHLPFTYGLGRVNSRWATFRQCDCLCLLSLIDSFSTRRWCCRLMPFGLMFALG